MVPGFKLMLITHRWSKQWTFLLVIYIYSRLNINDFASFFFHDFCLFNDYKWFILPFIFFCGQGILINTYFPSMLTQIDFPYKPVFAVFQFFWNTGKNSAHLVWKKKLYGCSEFLITCPIPLQCRWSVAPQNLAPSIWKGPQSLWRWENKTVSEKLRDLSEVMLKCVEESRPELSSNSCLVFFSDNAQHPGTTLVA